ncbi:hypothetical protein PG994_002704 [Apiospora phragmitis]|uniref:RNase III domain-containing protein n=1 Tax=Apiospora phragmitis TaxID=2905665 RepID=A0ABR1W639_9PEZI
MKKTNLAAPTQSPNSHIPHAGPTPPRHIFLRYGQPDRDEPLFPASFGAKIAKCEEILGYTFKCKPLLAEALTPEGGEVYYLGSGRSYATHASSRLAIYGDALMRAYMARQWLRCPPPAEATSSNRSWDLATSYHLSNRTLASAAQRLKLSECMHAKPRVQGLPGGWAQAQTVEALAAAAYLDGGDRALVQVMKLLGLDGVFHRGDLALGSCEGQQGKRIATDLRDKVDSAIRADQVVQDRPEDEGLLDLMI